MAVAQDIEPPFESANYNDVQLFMPYSGLNDNLGNGEPRFQYLMYQVVIFDKDSNLVNLHTQTGNSSIIDLNNTL